MHPMYAVVEFVAEKLTDDELAALNNVMQVEWDPRKIPGYEKAESLFTERRGDVPIAHNGIKEAFAQVVIRRIGRPDPDFEDQSLLRGLSKALEDQRTGRSPTFEEIAEELRQEREPPKA
jgi:hypothetical protein